MSSNNPAPDEGARKCEYCGKTVIEAMIKKPNSGAIKEKTKVFCSQACEWKMIELESEEEMEEES